MQKQKIFIGLMMLLSLGACTIENTEIGESLSAGEKVDMGNTGTGNSSSTNGENLTTNTGSQMAKYNAPKLENGDIVATIKTNNGTMSLKLFTTLVPKTTTNFIALSKKGYYDNVTFHRVIPDFMIQGGDPDGTGAGGESIYGEKFDDEFHTDLKNDRGTISMANAGPNTNGSQFFINVKDNNFLDNKHSVFGQVVEGIDVADKLSKLKTSGQDKPAKEVKMISVAIQEYKDGKLSDYDFNLEETLKKAEAVATAAKELNKTRETLATDIVMVHYKGTLEDGSVFDSSYERNAPIEVAISAGQVIPGFGNALVGMKIGDKKSIKLSPKDAYGEYDDTKTQDVPKANFEDQGIELVEGGTVPSAMGPLNILKITEETVTVDVNHPFAGKTLNFDLELVDFKS